MNKKYQTRFFFVFFVLSIGSALIFSGCLKTYKLVPSESSQGKELAEQDNVMRKNLRSVKVYDQWETVYHTMPGESHLLEPAYEVCKLCNKNMSRVFRERER